MTAPFICCCLCWWQHGQRWQILAQCCAPHLLLSLTCTGLHDLMQCQATLLSSSSRRRKGRSLASLCCAPHLPPLLAASLTTLQSAAKPARRGQAEGSGGVVEQLQASPTWVGTPHLPPIRALVLLLRGPRCKPTYPKAARVQQSQRGESFCSPRWACLLYSSRSTSRFRLCCRPPPCCWAWARPH